MAKVAEGIIDSLHLKKIDVLGYSVGGAVAQQLLRTGRSWFKKPSL